MIKYANQNDVRELPTINRSAVVLEPTEVYLQWAKECAEDDAELTLDELSKDCTTYLIPEPDAQPDAWLKRNYAAMFGHELYGWCMDETLWPEDRSFKNFKRFFRVRFHSLVVDMGGGEIVRDVE